MNTSLPSPALAAVHDETLVHQTNLMRSIRDQNVSTLLQHLTQYGPTGRKQLARWTGLSPTTVTRLISSLVTTGILVESAARNNPPGTVTGRPERPLGFHSRGPLIIGTHIRANECTSSAFDLNGECIFNTHEEFAASTPDSVIAAALRATSDVRDAVGAQRILGIGVSTGGIVDSDGGIVTRSPQLDWADVDLKTPFLTFGLPILVDNSVRCFALGQQWSSSAPQPGTVLTVFVANVVGAALLIDHKLHRGPGAFAGAIEHFPTRSGLGVPCACGEMDCLGVTVTNEALHSRAIQLGYLPPTAGKEWATSDATPSQVALQLLRKERAQTLGEAVGIMSALVNPELTVIAGYLGDADDVETCLEAARKFEMKTTNGMAGTFTHRPAPSNVWDKSTAALVLDDFIRRPTSYVQELLG